MFDLSLKQNAICTTSSTFLTDNIQLLGNLQLRYPAMAEPE